MSDSSQREPDSPEQAALSPSEIIRYVVILLLVGFGVWYYYFNKPPLMTSQQAIGKTMGTDYLVKIADFPETGNWAALSTEIQQRLDEIDRAMSTFKPDSEVCRFNVSDSEDWYSVSADTADVVRIALEVSRLTGGAFDVTVLPLVEFWGFGPNGEADEKDPKTEVPRLLEHVGFEKLEVRLDPPALKKSDPALRIDLSAVAKGYAADAVARLLEKNKIANYFLEVGGEVRCRGKKDKQTDWTIGIEKPLIVPPGTIPRLQRKLHIDNASLATSGDYRSYRLIGGVRYSHIIDPRTGFPTERLEEGAIVPSERLGSVSVIRPDCAQADALATGLFVLGEQKGLELANRQGWQVLFLFRNEEKNPPVREAASSRFPSER